MRSVRLALVAFLTLSTAACSTFGRSGGPESGVDGNIPVAGASSALPDVFFAYDSSNLDSQAQGTLSQNAKWLKENNSTNVNVEGHCDERGTQEYNLALGERRARAVYDFLRSLGVAEAQLSTISYGEELPLDPGHSEMSWSKNRRAHFAAKK